MNTDTSSSLLKEISFLTTQYQLHGLSYLSVDNKMQRTLNHTQENKQSTNENTNKNKII
jgi:hypothetical protein